MCPRNLRNTTRNVNKIRTTLFLWPEPLFTYSVWYRKVWQNYDKLWCWTSHFGFKIVIRMLDGERQQSRASAVEHGVAFRFNRIKQRTTNTEMNWWKGNTITLCKYKRFLSIVARFSLCSNFLFTYFCVVGLFGKTFCCVTNNLSQIVYMCDSILKIPIHQVFSDYKQKHINKWKSGPWARKLAIHSNDLFECYCS